MLRDRSDPESQAAAACGLTRVQLRQLRSLVAQRQRLAWEIGDIVYAAYGAPSRVRDGTYERLRPLADELGVSVSWLASLRVCSHAWPVRERRPTVAWACHRRLCAEPDRFRLLDDFRSDCDRKGHVPSHRLLVDWLDARRVTRPTLGRPPTDPVTRLERLALRLDHDALTLLVARLTAALALDRAA